MTIMGSYSTFRASNVDYGRPSYDAAQSLSQPWPGSSDHGYISQRQSASFSPIENPPSPVDMNNYVPHGLGGFDRYSPILASGLPINPTTPNQGEYAFDFKV